MNFLLEKFTLCVFNEKLLKNCFAFDCGHSDLNEYFNKDAIPYAKQLLGKSYCFMLDENPKIIVCAFTISNDSIKTLDLPNNRKKKVISDIPYSKQMRSYPAVLVGRLGVHKEYRLVSGENQRTSDQLMDFIKSWFVDNNNKTGCRFLVVDAYNEDGVLNFYDKNGFKMVFSTEEQEKRYYHITSDEKLHTRLMYFDLIKLKIGS